MPKMHQCNNCENDIPWLDTGGLVVTDPYDPEKVYAAICGVCTDKVQVAKIVLSREDTQKDFTYEGYLPAKVER